MRAACPQKIIPDHLYPMPAHQLATLLSDIIPAARRGPPLDPASSSPSHPRPAEQEVTSSAPPLPTAAAAAAGVAEPDVLPPGAHLVYFPPLMAASELAEDGADADHVPPGFKLETPEHPRGGRRLWVGGELTFREGWEDRMRLDGRSVVCVERIGDVAVQDGGNKTFVDLTRTYNLDGNSSTSYEIEERRRLAFITEEVMRRNEMKEGQGNSSAKILKSKKNRNFPFHPFP